MRTYDDWKCDDSATYPEPLYCEDCFKPCTQAKDCGCCRVCEQNQEPDYDAKCYCGHALGLHDDGKDACLDCLCVEFRDVVTVGKLLADGLAEGMRK